MAKFEGYKDIYVFVEQKNGEIANVGYELISEARKLVASIPSLSFQVVGVLLGHNIKDKAQDVIAHGADKVIVVDDALLEGYSTQFYADALTQVITEFKPDSFLTGATVLGRDLAPRVAARLNAGLTGRCDQDRDRPDQGRQMARHCCWLPVRLSAETCSAPSSARTLVRRWRPSVRTCSPWMHRMHPERVKSLNSHRSGPIRILRSSSRKSLPRYRKALTSRRRISWSVLDAAQKTAWIWSRAVAEELGGEMCASRAVVDDGFADKAIQVGQTGKTVRPSLYIACGISGRLPARCRHGRSLT